MSTCTFEGQPLVEVFGVRCLHDGGEAPAGTVTVYDGKRGQIIYSRGPDDKPSSRQAQRSGGLPLTGPYRAISADGCVAIVLDLHHSRRDTASPPTEILLDVYDESTRYDEAIRYVDGHTEVTYALLISDAAEAIVEVRLLRPRENGHTVGGTIVADIKLGKVVLFDDDGGATVGAEEGIIPLARSVVAVPLKSSLTVEVDLVVDGGDREVVQESVVCEPKLGSELVCRRPADGVAAVEVKVTWLD